MNPLRPFLRLALCASLPILLSGCLASFGTPRPEPQPPGGPVEPLLARGVYSCGKTWASCVPVAGANIAVSFKDQNRPPRSTLLVVCDSNDWKLNEKGELVCSPSPEPSNPK